MSMRSAAVPRVAAATTRRRPSLRRRAQVIANAARFGVNVLTGLYGGAAHTPTAPAALLIGITNKCNLRCDFCFHAGHDVPAGATRAKGSMPIERFAAIVAQARDWCTHLEFGLFGEPMAHPRFLEMARMAVDAGFTVALYTNGTLLDARRAAALVEIGLASVSISMEGATPAEYDRLRVGAQWEQVAANVRGLVAARGAAGSARPRIIVRGIALPAHAAQRSAHAALYRGLGVDQVMWMPPTDWSGSLQAPQGSIPRAATPPHTRPCDFPRLQLGVDWDGTAVPCCVDFNAKNRLGNVDQTSLQTLWNGPELAALRAALATRDRARIDAATGCAGCSQLRQPALPAGKQLQLVRMALGEFRARLADG